MQHYTQPFKFFAYTIALTWAVWFGAAYLSYQPNGDALLFPLMVLGTFIPFIVALVLILRSGNPALRQDFRSRLTDLRRIHLADLPVIFLLMPATILLAIAISVLFGGSTSQFGLSDLFTFSGEASLGLMISILAPTTEELGWRGYGVDSLRSRFSFFKASLLFTLLWGLWHVPLFFIKDYYQNELWHLGLPYVANFFISILPLTLIMNWFYERNGRSIPVAMLLHIMAVIGAEIFLVVDSVKFIQTGILFVMALGLVLRGKSTAAPTGVRQAS